MYEYVVLVYSYGFLPIRGWSYGTSHVSWVEPNPGQGGFVFARLRNPFFFFFLFPVCRLSGGQDATGALGLPGLWHDPSSM